MQLQPIIQHFARGKDWSNWLGVGLVLVAARGLLAGAGWRCRRLARSGGKPESARKFLHLGMGLIAMAYPWLFDRAWPVVLLSGVFIGLLLARHVFTPLKYHVAGVIYGVRRSSAGEYYFPLVTVLLFLLARGDRPLYLIPLSFMVFADTAAALVGTHYGKTRYGPAGATKSVEGSMAFFATAAGSGLLCFSALGETDPIRAILTSLVLAQLAAVLEGALSRGLDNLLMPLATLAAMQSLLELTVLRLAICALAPPITAVVAWTAWRASHVAVSAEAKSTRS